MALAQDRRSFVAVEAIVGYPLFLIVFIFVAVNALQTSSGRIVGVVAALGALVLLRSVPTANYVATVNADGSVTFRALARSTTTTVHDIYRMRARTGYRGATMWSFYFTGGSASLNGLAGRALARYVIERNPGVDCPSRWRSSLPAAVAPAFTGGQPPRLGTARRSNSRIIGLVLGGFLLSLLVWRLVQETGLVKVAHAQVRTTDCYTNAGGNVVWTGTVTTNEPNPSGILVVRFVQPDGTLISTIEEPIDGPSPANSPIARAANGGARPAPHAGAIRCDASFQFRTGSAGGAG